tara:strand:+ start:47 stop:721 length:675 start_codon:yes stop_codon:yes gene_type:complete
MTTQQEEVAPPPVRNRFYDLPDDLRRKIELRVELYHHANEIRARASGILASTETWWCVQGRARELGMHPFVYRAKCFMQMLYPQQYEEMWPLDERTPGVDEEELSPWQGSRWRPWGRSELYGLQIDALDLDWGGVEDDAEFRTRRFKDWILRSGVNHWAKDFLYAPVERDYVEGVVLRCMHDWGDQGCAVWNEDGSFRYVDMADLERFIIDTLLEIFSKDDEEW